MKISLYGVKSEAVRTINDVCRASVNDGMPEHSRESQRSGQMELSKLRLDINVSYIFLLDRSLCSILKDIQCEGKLLATPIKHGCLQQTHVSLGPNSV